LLDLRLGVVQDGFHDLLLHEGSVTDIVTLGLQLTEHSTDGIEDVKVRSSSDVTFIRWEREDGDGIPESLSFGSKRKIQILRPDQGGIRVSVQSGAKCTTRAFLIKSFFDSVRSSQTAIPKNQNENMNRFSFALLLSLLASVQAFMVAPSVRMVSFQDRVSMPSESHCGLTYLLRHDPQAPRTQMNLMPAEDTDSIIAQANDCVEGECSLDEVEDLIQVLKTQQKELYDRVEQIRGMVKSLETGDVQDEREVDQIRETVRAIFRVFQLGDKASGNDYPSLSRPTGWSGEVGDGPTTAYDALPPKPYKKSP
jgi:hypothetical protein